MTAKEALEIAVEHNGSRPLIESSVHEQLPPNCFVYGNFKDCWFILSSFDTRSVLRSSRLIIVSRLLAKVIFDGDANDEG
jgi:hypothetical protein